MFSEMTPLRSGALLADVHRSRHALVLWTAMLALVLLAAAFPARGQGTLENPAEFGFESGIGVVSGWVCEAERVEIVFDDFEPVSAAYGTSRADTEPVCGDSDNGFSLLWNYSILGPGQHEVRAFADGVEFGRAQFQVSTLGAEFVQGLEAVTDFTSLEIGKEIELRWVESKQGFVISNVWDADFSLEDLIAAIGGTWSGMWHSPLGMGTVTMTFAGSEGGGIAISGLTLSATGCAASAQSVSDLENIEEPIIEAVMNDGSRVEFELVGTESFTTLGGVFWFLDGPCEDTDGLFYMFRQ